MRAPSQRSRVAQLFCRQKVTTNIGLSSARAIFLASLKSGAQLIWAGDCDICCQLPSLRDFFRCRACSFGKSSKIGWASSAATDKSGKSRGPFKLVRKERPKRRIDPVSALRELSSISFLHIIAVIISPTIHICKVQAGSGEQNRESLMLHEWLQCARANGMVAPSLIGIQVP